MTTEKKIENEVLTYLSTVEDFFAFKINTTGIFDPKTKKFRKIVNKFIHKGTSDILACYKGRFIAIEIKKPAPNKTYESKDQKLFASIVRDNGGLSYVVRSKDEMIQILEEIKCLENWDVSKKQKN